MSTCGSTTSTRVVLSGSDANLAQLREVLPRSLQDKVVGQINLDMNASPAEVWERAFEVATAAQRQAEADLLEQVITAARKGGAGALGLTDTLSALQQGRIYRLAWSPVTSSSRVTGAAIVARCSSGRWRSARIARVAW